MTNTRLENLLTTTALVLLVGGCFVVLAPFLSALLWAIIVTFSTWGAHVRVHRALGGRKTLAALVMTLTLAAVLVVPVAAVTMKLGDNAQNLTSAVTSMVREGVPMPPAWVGEIPWVGSRVEGYWLELREQSRARENAGQAMQWLESQAAPITKWLLQRGLAFGQALLQLTLVVLAAFYLYRDGVAVAGRFSAGLERIAGQRAHALIDLAGRTIKGVVYGILGTAIAQGTVATIGFALAEVPGALLLGLLTCVASIILPAGPPLIWVPAGLWLMSQGEPGWAVFMFAWGAFAISGIDNVVKPYLISQGAALPFLLVLLGVIGGLLAFGFVGIFLGPTLLAVGYAMLREWTRGVGRLGVEQPGADPPA
jgi:predicted PurR-regulated permease PerM